MLTKEAASSFRKSLHRSKKTSDRKNEAFVLAASEKIEEGSGGGEQGEVVVFPIAKIIGGKGHKKEKKPSTGE